MADNDLKIWHNNLLPNPFHMVDAKFDLFLRPISHGNPAMPFAKFLLAAQNLVHLRVPSTTVSFMLRQSCGSSKKKVFQNLQP